MQNRRKTVMRILFLNGPNLNLLGEREPSLYGHTPLEDINNGIREKAKDIGAEVLFFQSNHEGEIVESIQKAKSQFDVLVINPAAFTHTSVAIRDALLAVNLPTIEVHLSNPAAREGFRQESLISDVVVGTISGFGEGSYYLALQAAAELGSKKE
jgi:3-dehydroquinate dehydratase-2